MRLRDLGLPIPLGWLPPGPHNAITDVPGVRVGHTTLIEGEGALVVGQGPVRTGVTVIHPRRGSTRDEPVFAGCHTLNGNGDMTGLEWIREAGTLTTPVALTNTHSLGVVRDALISWERRERQGRALYWSMPVVGETFDGVLNDIDGMHVRPGHVWAAADTAQGGPVAEGAVGGGTGMISYGFKGGIGTSSRVLSPEVGGYTLGTLVQANHGRRRDLRVMGLPVGGALQGAAHPELPVTPGSGSVVVILATDAPLLPQQCTRLARRAGVGVARGGAGCDDSSGDLFLCFATGNQGLPVAGYERATYGERQVRLVTNDTLSALFHAAAEAVEEAIVNALLAAHTLTGRDGITAHALRGEQLKEALRVLGRSLAGPERR